VRLTVKTYTGLSGGGLWAPWNIPQWAPRSPPFLGSLQGRISRAAKARPTTCPGRCFARNTLAFFKVFIYRTPHPHLSTLSVVAPSPALSPSRTPTNLKLCPRTWFYFAHRATLHIPHSPVITPRALTFLLLLQLPQVQHCGHFGRHCSAQVGNRRCGGAPRGREQVRTGAEGGGEHLGEQLLGLDRVQVMENLQE
jgi:hypothetical protein